MKFCNPTYAVALLLIISANDLFADAGVRFYEEGDFEKAIEHYRNVTNKKSDQWQGFYNLGSAAYKAGQIDTAVEAFEKSLATDQLDLREKAFYNLGNTYYRMGEASEQQGPQAAIPIYEKALGGYQSALDINPEDEDAKFNAELVQKRIEELKQQQEQQEQQQNSDSDEDSKDLQEQDQEQPDQSKSENSEGDQDEGEQQKDQADQQQEADQGEQEDQENSADPSQEAQANSGQEPLESTDNFDKTRAGIFLDTLQEDEKTWNFFPELQSDMDPETDPGKDW